MSATSIRGWLVDMNTLMHMGHGPGFPGLLTLLLVVVLIVALLRRGGIGPVRFQPEGGGGPRPPWAPRHPSPDDVAMATLAERLASGDITPEEYLERSSVLRPSASSGDPSAREE
ncbi:MAG: hypothetical protein ACK5LN_09965 [Propioniciclava sp.]